VQAAFLHKFVRNQQDRIRRNSISAAWTRDAQGTKEQALRAETELRQLVTDLRSSATVDAAFYQEWIEHERHVQLSLHEVELQCNADVTRLRAGCSTLAASDVVEQHVQCAAQLDKDVWDLSQDIR
jgi:hypothetical protein